MALKKKPALRFKDFTDDWEQRKLGEIGSTFTGLSGKTKEDFGHGDARFVTYMNVYSNSIADLAMTERVEIDQTQNSVKYGDIFFTTSSETPNEVGMSSVWLGNTENTYLNSFCFGYRPEVKVNPYYMAYMLRSPNVRNKLIILAQGISRYNISKNRVMDIEVPTPDLSEQKEIGQYFFNLDHLITLHQRKYEMLKKIKKSFLEKMFPKNGKRVPELRFSGFTDDWEQRKLSEMVIRYEDPIVTPHDGYTRLGIRSHAKGTFYEYVAPGHELETAQMHRVAADKLIFNITFAWEHAVAITTKDDAGKLVSHRFPQFTLSESLRPEFLKYIILDEGFHHNLYLASPGGAGRNRVLKIDEALDYPICFPSFEEQHKIGEFLNKLSNLITLHQRKLEKLQNLKKALLKKMFI